MNWGLKNLGCFLLAMMAATALSPMAAAASEIAGTYGNDRVSLALRPADANGVVSGTVTIDGKGFPCAGRVDTATKTFNGSLESAGSRFPLNFSPAADGAFVLTSGNARYVLKQTDAAPAPHEPKLDPAATKLPQFFQPGLRLSWSSGDSTREGVTLELDPKGWILKNGHRYSIVGHAGKGQEGLRQLTVQQADDEALIGEIRNFTINANLQGKTISTANFNFAAGKGTSLDVYWVHPAILAALPQGREEDGQVTMRGKTVIDGHEFNTINIAKTDAAGSSSLTYDLATGTLLSLLRADITPDLIISTPQGSTSFNGTCHIERLTFVNARQIKFAWGGEVTPPEWAGQGARFDIAGNYKAVIEQTPGLPQIPDTNPGFPIAFSYQFRAGTKQVALADFQMVKKVDRGGLDDRAQGIRCFGSHSYISSFWASPKVLAGMQPNQVLDEDRVTGYRTIFAGVRGNLAVIAEVGPNETNEVSFDLQSGRAVLFKNSIQLLPGAAQVTQMQIVQRP